MKNLNSLLTLAKSRSLPDAIVMGKKEGRRGEIFS
jgi:hypothetical protein